MFDIGLSRLLLLLLLLLLLYRGCGGKRPGSRPRGGAGGGFGVCPMMCTVTFCPSIWPPAMCSMAASTSFFSLYSTKA